MIDVSLYKRGDSYQIDLIPGVFEPAGYLRANTEMLCQSHGVIAHTLRENGRVVAIFGLTIIWPGVVEVWSLLSREVKRIPLAVIKNILLGLSFYQKHLHVKRFQMTVKNDYMDGHRFARFLGFTHEGVMHAWGPDGSDFALYGRVF